MPDVVDDGRAPMPRSLSSVGRLRHGLSGDRVTTSFVMIVLDGARRHPCPISCFFSVSVGLNRLPRCSLAQ